MPNPAERIYSTSQLLEALQSGIMGLKEQLQADLEALVNLTVKHMQGVEDQKRQQKATSAAAQIQHAQMTQKLKAANAAKERVQEDLDRQARANSKLQLQLEAAQESRKQAEQQVWDMERSKHDLAEQVEKHKGDSEFLEGELAGLKQQTAALQEQATGLREQVAVQQEQLANMRQELAVKSSELSLTSTALQENKNSLAHTRSQLAAVQDNLSGQLRALQRELASAQADKQQNDREVGRLNQEVTALAATLAKSQAEVNRLREWQDVAKRMADDKVQEAAEQLASAKEQAVKRQTTLAGEAASLQERLAARESQLASLQQELGLLQIHVRDAQRSQAVAAEAQAATGKALDTQCAELAALRQKLKDAEVAMERARGDHLAAESGLREAIAAERAQLAAQIDEARREVAVKEALCSGWQRANQALQDKVKQLEGSLTSATASSDASLSAMRVELETERATVRRITMEAASAAKQYEQIVQRLRREADAGAEEVIRLQQLQPSGPFQQGQTSAGLQCDAATAGYIDGLAPGVAAADPLLVGIASPHIQQELMHLRRAMHAISGNLLAADATMQRVTAARSQQSSPATTMHQGGMAPMQHTGAQVQQRQQQPLPQQQYWQEGGGLHAGPVPEPAGSSAQVRATVAGDGMQVVSNKGLSPTSSAVTNKPTASSRKTAAAAAEKQAPSRSAASKAAATRPAGMTKATATPRKKAAVPASTRGS